MLMIDDEFSLVDKEVFHLDEEHRGRSVLVLLPKWEILAWGPFEMARVLQIQLKDGGDMLPADVAICIQQF